jgi:hypothetical protein
MRIYGSDVGSQEVFCVRDRKPERFINIPELSVFVVVTSTNATLKALEIAGEIAVSLGSSIVLVAAQMILFPLTIDKPLLSIAFLTERLETAAIPASGGIKAFVYLYRDPPDTLTTIFKFNSPWFSVSGKAGGQSRDGILARKLERAGSSFILVETE